MRESEISNLRDQLELVRREKHEVEEERAENAKQRDKEVISYILVHNLARQRYGGNNIAWEQTYPKI